MAGDVGARDDEVVVDIVADGEARVGILWERADGRRRRKKRSRRGVIRELDGGALLVRARLRAARIQRGGWRLFRVGVMRVEACGLILVQGVADLLACVFLQERALLRETGTTARADLLPGGVVVATLGTEDVVRLRGGHVQVGCDALGFTVQKSQHSVTREANEQEETRASQTVCARSDGIRGASRARLEVDSWGVSRARAMQAGGHELSPRPPVQLRSREERIGQRGAKHTVRRREQCGGPENTGAPVCKRAVTVKPVVLWPATLLPPTSALQPSPWRLTQISMVEASRSTRL